MRPQKLNLTSSLLLLLSGLACQDPLAQELSLSPDVQRPEPAAIVFFVDGLDVRSVQHLLEQGRLPNIQRLFVRGGCRVECAFACLPSVTYANIVSFLTGCTPGRHGITGNTWFDRSTLLFRDYGTFLDYFDVDRDFQTPTIYELIRPADSVSAMLPVAGGAAERFLDPIASTHEWIGERYMDVDRRSASQIVHVFRHANRSGAWPLIQTYYFPGVDATAHDYGIESQQYESCAVHVDQLIGVLWSKFQSAGLAEQTYFFLVSDHGHVAVPANRRIDLAKHLTKSRNHKILIARDGLSAGRVADADAVFLCADRHGFVFVRRRHDSEAAPAAEDVEKLVEAFLIPERADEKRSLKRCRRIPKWIGVIAAKLAPDRLLLLASGEEIIVNTKDLAADRRRPETMVRDSAVPATAGDDRANRKTPPASRATACEPSIQPTMASVIRDRRIQQELAVLLGGNRSGDIVVFAADDWAFHDQGASTHGSVLLADRRIACMVAGPGIPPQSRIAHARIVDVMPTILDLLGHADRIPPDIDGVSFAPRVRNAGPADGAKAVSPAGVRR